MSNLLQKVLDWIKVQDGKSIIGISGHGASGKTTFSEHLISSLEDHSINYLNTDPYIIPSALRKYAQIDYDYKDELHRYKMTACHPLAHHTSALERDIKMIKAGFDLQPIEAFYLPNTLLSGQCTLTIVEGMSTAFVQPDLFDLSIYFYTDSDTEWRRRNSRDITERGSTLEYLNHSHLERRAQYELFMHPRRNTFDIVLNTSQDQFIIEKSFF